MHDKPRITTADEHPLDTNASLLTDRRRRTVVALLSEEDAPIPLYDLARAVASREQGGDSEPLGDQIKTVATELHHNHLPRLDEADVIRYDWERKRVSPSGVERLVAGQGTTESAR